MNQHQKDWEDATKAVKKRIAKPTMLDVHNSPEWQVACAKRPITRMSQIRI